MKMEVTVYEAMDIMKNCNRDYFTIEGMEMIMNFYDENMPEADFNPVNICCTFTEYGKGAACSFKDLIDDYGYLLPLAEYAENADVDEEEVDMKDYINTLLETLEDYTCVLYPENGNAVVMLF